MKISVDVHNSPAASSAAHQANRDVSLPRNRLPGYLPGLLPGDVPSRDGLRSVGPLHHLLLHLFLLAVGVIRLFAR